MNSKSSYDTMCRSKSHHGSNSGSKKSKLHIFNPFESESSATRPENEAARRGATGSDINRV